MSFGVAPAALAATLAEDLALPPADGSRLVFVRAAARGKARPAAVVPYLGPLELEPLAGQGKLCSRRP